MSDLDKDLAKEIVIVKRRRGGGDEGHHGGVWKIAYADFMTAMMAFFLVMWLVNMTDDKTIVQIANYFNPLQLTDRNPTEKGLYDSDPSSEAKSSSDDAERSEGDKKPRSPGKARMEKARKEKAASQEAKLFVDPLKTLDGVAKSEDGAIPEAGPEDSLAGMDEQATPRQLYPTGPDTFDPFDPFMEKTLDPAIKQDATQPGLIGKADASKEGGSSPRGTASAEGQSGSDANSEAGASDQKTPQSDKAAQTSAQLEAKKIADTIESSIQKATAGLRDAGPDVSVVLTDEGVLVSLMDSEKFEMFKIGSAEPVPSVVKLIDRLGQIILESKKTVVVRGHTDARQFRQSSYDNWRLSTARAHMAHYMLQRTGIMDGQVERIEGYASSRLRNEKDPLAAENRRIEFLLRLEKK